MWKRQDRNEIAVLYSGPDSSRKRPSRCPDASIERTFDCPSRPSRPTLTLY